MLSKVLTCPNKAFEHLNKIQQNNSITDDAHKSRYYYSEKIILCIAIVSVINRIQPGTHTNGAQSAVGRERIDIHF